MTFLPAAPDRIRALELQADRSLQGLDDQEEQELRGLLATHPDLDTDEMELAAAALDLAWSADELSRPLPAGLSDALRSLAARSAVGRPALAEASNAGARHDHPRQTARDRSVFGPLGWLVAAACLVWVGAQRWQSQAPSMEAARARLVAASTNLLSASWTSTDDPAGAALTGDLVWSNERQRGFMRFRGLAANDRSREQYQLWIFDRKQAYPVDGGVFDSAGGEILVPIDAKLKVVEPWQFAVTVEKPGGVVVSQQERVVALAAP